MIQPDPTVLWTPRPDTVPQTAMSRFAAQAGFELGAGLADYAKLWEWSVNDLDGFWSSVWRYYGLDRFGSASPALADSALPGACWFPDARLNIADHILSHGADEDIAIIGTTEPGETSTLTWAQLRSQVASLAHSFRELGVGVGDRVVGYLPNIPEVVIAFLATASIGAVWSGVGQDYAAQAVVDRMSQLEPTVLVAATGYRYAGRWHDRNAEIERIRTGLPTVSHTIVVTRNDDDVPGDERLAWDSLVGREVESDHQLVPFDHPLWVLFSSGTTGLPKGIVHGHGGVLLEQLKFLGLHTDLDPDGRFLWYSSPSWVMWNIQACGLATGASIVCYDGSPTHPGPQRLWQVVADQDVTVFGSSPAFLEASRQAGLHPARQFDLSALRTLSTSGSPIASTTHAWATSATGGVPLFSISGGTDVASAFCGGSPTVEVRAGEIPVRCLGVALDAWDEEGRSVRDGLGELVVTRPMPSMPLRFWNDKSGDRYRDSYFAMYPGTWRHGDWITLTGRGSVVVHGRSDSTLNRNGIRMGSADVYHALDELPEIADALVLGIEEEGGGYWMPLFVTLRTGHALDTALRDRIAEAVRKHASPHHVPDEIIQVDGIPYTRTGKRLEIPIKRLFQGAETARHIQPDSIDAPELLPQFVRLAQQRRNRV